MSGSTTWRRMASAWMTSARRSWMRPSWVPGRLRRWVKASTPRTTCPTFWPAGRRWRRRQSAPGTAQSFAVPAAEIIATGSWDLSLNRYKEIEHEEVNHAAPAEIIAELRALEAEINEGLDRLEGVLG